MDRNKLIKGLMLLTAVFVLVGTLTQASKRNSLTLEDYAKGNPEIAYMEKETPSPSPSPSPEPPTMTNSENSSENVSSSLIGSSLNGDSVIEKRITYEQDFYYEPLSDNLRRYITGISFPSYEADNEAATNLAISYEDLSYLHLIHYDFEGNAVEGELICNSSISQDLVEIFYELYCNEYQLEKVRLIDEYDGDDTASMEDNNTSCFNYRLVEGSSSLSKHALGLALDINPFYNPYVTYEKDGRENVSPEAALEYANRDTSFPYKIDEKDLCYKLFIEHGFTWGGNWNSCKDYQHFQKVIKK